MALFEGWRRLDGPEFHAIIAAIVVVAGLWAGLSPLLALAANTVGWYALEAWQGNRDDKGVNPFSGRWGWRKRLELSAPIVTGAVVVAVVMAW